MIVSVEAATPNTGLTAAFLVGRVLLAAIFLNSARGHLLQVGPTAQYAGSMGVPVPRLSTIVTGLMILAGGLSVLLGLYVAVGCLLLVLFLVPVALMMHPFWKMTDPMSRAIQQAQFMKNLSMAGAALVICYFTVLHPEDWVYSLRP